MLVVQVIQVHKEEREQQVRLDCKDQLVPLVPPAVLESLELKVHKVQKVTLAHQGQLGCKEVLDPQALQDFKVVLEIQEQQEVQVPLEQQVQLALQVLLEPLGLVAQVETLAHPELQVLKGVLAPVVQLVPVAVQE